MCGRIVIAHPGVDAGAEDLASTDEERADPQFARDCVLDIELYNCPQQVNLVRPYR
jgi:hypothetical protein